MNCDLRFMNHLVELLFDYKIKGSLKRFVDVIYSITKFKRKVFVLSVLCCRHIVISRSTRPRLWIGDLDYQFKHFAGGAAFYS